MSLPVFYSMVLYSFSNFTEISQIKNKVKDHSKSDDLILKGSAVNGGFDLF